RREILGEWIGLRQELFPPSNRLNDEQMAHLLDAMTQCLDVYNFIPHFPAGLPVRKRYDVLVAQLGKEVPILMHNAWQIDFCEYEPRNCPFDEAFCQCKVYEQWLTHLDEDGNLDEEAMENRIDRPHLPDFLFDSEEEDFDDEEDFYFEEEDDYYDDEDEYDYDEDDEDNDGLFLSDFPDLEPG
ncbi:MAG: hypothetical protein KDD06_12940, partial [Phaeodactylibacter sp.]|nr:hypothetical protein [Phaeodactylibacter sp.]